MEHTRKISVIGLGYVGLPVAMAFGEKEPVIGFDINPKRIDSLNNGKDWTHEVTSQDLAKTKVLFTCDPHQLRAADFHIIAVPTPIDEAHKPDLSALRQASEIVGSQLKVGDLVVYESTVYPGATEEVCIPLLEKHSKLQNGKDFKVGYSPERLNPGDYSHTFTSIIKVVAGQDKETLKIISQVYSSVVKVGIYEAESIKIAEAAKVIENTQRDLNIALMNELAIIFEKMGLDTQDVIRAASTKWNFLQFSPGLVGGHCIGVDPYYLTFKAKQLGYRPEVILAGRRINDGMGCYIAKQTIKKMIQADCLIKGASVFILGLTFKENCSDLRNSKVIDVIRELQSYGVQVLVHDPLANPQEAEELYGVKIVPWEEIPQVDAIVLCVAHKHYLELSTQEYAQKLQQRGFIFDVKGQLNSASFASNNIKIWRL